MGPDYKGFNSTGVLGAAGIRTFVATSPETARGALADAAGAALQGGAAALLLPVNVQLADMDLAKAPTPPAQKPPRPPAAPRAQAIEAAAALVRQSRKPLIVAGLGAHRAGAKAELEQLADRIGALLVTSARGKDMFRGHPANLGIVGSFSHSAARRMIDRGRLRAGVRRRAQSPHHELRPFAAQGAADPGRCGSRPYRPLASRRCRRGGRRAAGGAGPARGAAARLQRRPAVPLRGDAGLPARLRHRARFHSRPTRRARSIRARSAWRWRSCCRPTATSSTTPATSWASCPTCPCPIRAVSS